MLILAPAMLGSALPNAVAQSADSSIVHLALVGDVLPMGVPDPFRDDGVRRILRGADIAFGNLESPLSERGRQIPLKFRNGRLIHNEFLFRAKPFKAQSLRNGGFDVVSLSNNHMMDYGPVALSDTLTALKRYGIAHTGAGANLSQARRPAIVAKNGVRVAFLAYIQNGYKMLPATRGFAATANEAGLAFVNHDGRGTPTAATVRMLRSDIAQARRNADVVVVSFHWGEERRSRPSTFQRRLAHRMVEAGADVIVGHHSHCLQGVEVYGGTPIFYSLGNFVFRSWDSLTKRTGIVQLTLDARGVRRVVFRPAWIRRVRPYLSRGRSAEKTAQRFINLSRPLKTRLLTAKQDGLPVAVLDVRANQSKRDVTQRDVIPLFQLVAAQTPHTAPSDWVEVTHVVPNVRIDLRYATTKNFFKKRFYSANRAFLRRGTAQRLRRAQAELDRYGLRLKVWDAYRPLEVQRAMWNQVRDRRYVAHPKSGSHHNRGAAVDVTLVNRRGRQLEMPTGYDDFSRRAHADYRHPSLQVRRHRYWLRHAMTAAGFRPLATEWWHFSDPDAHRYSLTSISLRELSTNPR